MPLSLMIYKIDLNVCLQSTENYFGHGKILPNIDLWWRKDISMVELVIFNIGKHVY